ncbi:MAG: peptide deformylase [Candidatus Gastranaerophilales bacterium]|nr:peptide deformylase [Candidatus Gastranaerophilales bacterium]
MGVLKVRVYGDEVLRQKAKEVSKISKKIHTLAENMLMTLYSYNGVGLAAPQVGESIRMFVIDVSEANQPKHPIFFINPKIIKKSGAVNSYEGCLSFPEVYTDVRRYKNVTVKALNLSGKPFVVEAKDGELLAIAIQHEFDHLNGKLFVDHARNRFETDEKLISNNLNPIEMEYFLEEPELEEEIAKESPKQDEQEN